MPTKGELQSLDKLPVCWRTKENHVRFILKPTPTPPHSRMSSWTNHSQFEVRVFWVRSWRQRSPKSAWGGHPFAEECVCLLFLASSILVCSWFHSTSCYWSKSSPFNSPTAELSCLLYRCSKKYQGCLHCKQKPRQHKHLSQQKRDWLHVWK